MFRFKLRPLKLKTKGKTIKIMVNKHKIYLIINSSISLQILKKFLEEKFFIAKVFKSLTSSKIVIGEAIRYVF